MRSRSTVVVGLGLLSLAWGTGALGAGFPRLENAAAWQKLPPTKSGSRDEPLPTWARIYVQVAPAVTAALLELDRTYRTENPLPPLLRAKIRWIAAQTNGCKYTAATAAADFQRAGGTGELPDVATFPGDPAKEERIAIFARQLCEAAYEVTDGQFQEILHDWGPEQTTAIVLTLAYANFQDRLVTMLGVELEPDGALPAVTAQFDWDALQEHPLPKIPRRIPEPPTDADRISTRVADPDWKAGPLAELQERLQHQELRSARIPIPADEVVEQNTPRGLYPPGRASKIKWNSVTMGYQPQLTMSWFFAMRRFRDESGLPDTFRQSVFWVVTRANWCFY